MDILDPIEQANGYGTSGMDSIEPIEKYFPSSDKATNFFNLLMEKQIVLQNPQCICCSQVFIKNLRVVNNNPLLPVMVDLSEKRGFETLTLERHVNAVCNEGGGAIVIGLERKN